MLAEIKNKCIIYIFPIARGISCKNVTKKMPFAVEPQE